MNALLFFQILVNFNLNHLCKLKIQMFGPNISNSNLFRFDKNLSEHEKMSN